MKELLLSFIFALVVGSIINGLGQTTPTSESLSSKPPQQSPSEQGGGGQPAEGAEQNSSQVVEASDSSFSSDVLDEDVPVLVEFGAKWCNPCKMMAPILEELASEYSGKLKVVRVDVDENKTLSEQYAQAGLPTLAVFQKGQVKKLLVGYTAKTALVKIIKPYIP